MRATTMLLTLAMALTAGLSVGDDGSAGLKLSRAGAGHPMPPFDLPSLDGTRLQSTQLLGKVVVLNFWATWCGPCKEEMPALDRLSRHFDPRDIAVLTVTTDRERRGIEQFLKQFDSDLPVLLDENRDVSLAFLIRGLPTTVVIAKDGTIVGRAVGPREWDSPEAVTLLNGLREGR